MVANNLGYVAVAKVVSPYKTQGWVKVIIYSGIPQRFDNVKVVFFKTGTGLEGRLIQQVRQAGEVVYLKFKDIDSLEAARELAGKEVLLPGSQTINLPEDTYFIHDLIGLEVFDTDSGYLGNITDVLTMAGNDIYVVKDNDKEVLIPAVGQFVEEVDIPGRKMVVHLWEEL